MTFLSLDWSATEPTRIAAHEFGRIVGDPSQQPVFVYDRDGTLAGSLWYVHFRLAEGLNPEQARTRAVRLGLSDSSNPEAVLERLLHPVP